MRHKIHFNKHIQAKKHKKMMGEKGKKVLKVLKSVKLRYSCEICNKQYKDRSGLRYVKKGNCEVQSVKNQKSMI